MPKRKECNDNFFEKIDSEIKAYLLGFLAADGNISSTDNRISIGLTEDDIEIINLFKKYIAPNSKIQDHHNKTIKRKPQKAIRFSSEKMITDLSQYGIVPQKSKHSFDLTNIPQEYKRDYIRGYFDGDGSFYYAKWRGRNKVCVNFTNSTSAILVSIQEELCKNNIHFKLEEKTSRTKTIYYVIACYSKPNFIEFGNYIYKNANFFLKRKLDKFRYVNTVLSPEITKGSGTV